MATDDAVGIEDGSEQDGVTAARGSAAQRQQPGSEGIEGECSGGFRRMLAGSDDMQDGRAVPLFRAGPADAARLHVIATRQHPPETTGALAFDAFATRLLALRSVAPCSSDAILFAPILNPDGIVRGHWRSNAALVDLNRDWGQFRQPETSLLGAAMRDLARSSRIATVLDFHSTRRGAIYVSRSAEAQASAFSAAVGAETGLAVVETRSADGNTLKSWSESMFGSASFTVELPDSASPDEAARVGATIADLFAHHYLCRAPGALP